MQNQKQQIRETNEALPDKQRRIHRQWDRASLGVAMIWAGTAWLLGLGWYAVLTGVGVVLLAEQFVRWRAALRPDGFWALAGCVALISGTAGLAGIQLPVMALVLIIAGLMVLGSVLRPKEQKKA